MNEKLIALVGLGGLILRRSGRSHLQEAPKSMIFKNRQENGSGSRRSLPCLRTRRRIARAPLVEYRPSARVRRQRSRDFQCHRGATPGYLTSGL